MPTKPDPRCPFCKDSMDEGFVLEVTRNRRAATEWVKGEPEKGFLGDLKIEKEMKRPIVSYRCARCGFLMDYAL